MQGSGSGDVGLGLVLALGVVLILVALFLIFRQFVLWYFRINERTELLKDIRDSLRQAQSPRSSWLPDREPQLAANDRIQRRPGESEDQFNSRVADQLQRQLRS